MKDYASMSDFEINRRVSIAMGEKFDIPKKPKPSPYLEITETTVSLLNCDGTRIERVIVKDYCNNPADAWPLIVSNQISLMYEEAIGKWCAGKPYWVDGCEWQLDIDVMEANPLRAAMIVFLMMKESGNDSQS